MWAKLYARKVGGSSREKSQVTTGDFQLQPADVGSDCLLLWRRRERDDIWEKTLGPSLSDSVKTTSGKTGTTFANLPFAPPSSVAEWHSPLQTHGRGAHGGQSHQGPSLQRPFSLSWKIPGTDACLTAARARAELVEQLQPLAIWSPAFSLEDRWAPTSAKELCSPGSFPGTRQFLNSGLKPVSDI